MNKFDLLGDEPPQLEIEFKVGDNVSLKQNWRLLSPHGNLPAQQDTLLDDLHIFKIIQIYNKKTIHIESIQSKHQNIVSNDWIELVRAPQYQYSVILKQGWVDYLPQNKKGSYYVVRAVSDVIKERNGAFQISHDEYIKFLKGEDPLIDAVDRDKNIIIRGKIERECIEDIVRMNSIQQKTFVRWEDFSNERLRWTQRGISAQTENVLLGHARSCHHIGVTNFPHEPQLQQNFYLDFTPHRSARDIFSNDLIEALVQNWLSVKNEPIKVENELGIKYYISEINHSGLIKFEKYIDEQI